jgi:hypothetical protein
MARDTYENKDELDAPAAPETLGNALIIVTTVVLIGAFVLVQQALAKHYGAGMFGDAKNAAKN